MDKEQKCKICGRVLSEDELFSSMLKYRQKGCAECSEVLNLQMLAIEHWNNFKATETSNPIEDKNYSEEKPLVTKNGTMVTFRTLSAHKTEYIVEGRTQYTKKVIEEIDKARRFLYQGIGPYFEILESMFDKDYQFWNDGGNLLYYIKNAVISYIVIHLKEYLDNNQHKKSKHSIYRFKNIIEHNRKKLFQDQKVFCVKTFKDSGDILKTKFELFPIEEYFKRLDNVLNKYNGIINTIDDYRDNVYAHTSSLKNKEESENQFTLINLRKIYNSLKIIYDCLYYSISPDTFAHLQYDFNIWYDHINHISRYYKEKVEKPQENDKQCSLSKSEELQK